MHVGALKEQNNNVYECFYHYVPVSPLENVKVYCCRITLFSRFSLHNINLFLPYFAWNKQSGVKKIKMLFCNVGFLL